MKTPVTPEKRREYMRKYLYKRSILIDARQLKAAKCIEVQYQGCACRDRMSKAEFYRHKDTDFPAGTRVFVGDKSWVIK